jgi:hypothetical protein
MTRAPNVSIATRLFICSSVEPSVSREMTWRRKAALPLGNGGATPARLMLDRRHARGFKSGSRRHITVRTSSRCARHIISAFQSEIHALRRRDVDRGSVSRLTTASDVRTLDVCCSGYAADMRHACITRLWSGEQPNETTVVLPPFHHLIFKIYPTIKVHLTF